MFSNCMVEQILLIQNKYEISRNLQKVGVKYWWIMLFKTAKLLFILKQIIINATISVYRQSSSQQTRDVDPMLV